MLSETDLVQIPTRLDLDVTQAFDRFQRVAHLAIGQAEDTPRATGGLRRAKDALEWPARLH